jgi:excisionase family DNA binding protein
VWFAAQVSRLVDAHAAAEHLGVPVSWVREQVRNGTIPYIPLGPRYRRFDLERLDAWVADLAREPAGAAPRYRKHVPKNERQ